MRNILMLTLLVLMSLGIGLLLLEGVYRWQLVDTYASELHTFNLDERLRDIGKPTLLIMGDSFTASRASYAGLLQETLQEWRVVNAAVSGTGVLQALYMAPQRFADFRPFLFVYQVYVGNDLFDLRYPTSGPTIAPLRNLYWWIANHLRVVSYLNYRLRQLKEAWTTPQSQALTSSSATVAATEPSETFTVERYDVRTTIYFQAEPSLLEDTLLVQGARRQDYALFLEKLSALVRYCAPEVCRALILVIPHVCQIDATSLLHMRQLGARFTTPSLLSVPEYPFLTRLQEHFRAWPNVQMLNPLPMLRDAQAQQAVYYVHDEHLNPRGQQLLASWLAPRLRHP
jgi:hypothetical protein